MSIQVKQASIISYLTLLIIALVVAVAVLPVRAQDEAATTAAEGLYAGADTSARQQELRALYQALVEDYSVKVRQFSLNRAQWQSIQTLRSLEDAVSATTAVLVARDKTMVTYFELLLETLNATQGIELTLKDASKQELTDRIVWLKNHQQQSEVSVDRDSVNDRADEYTQMAETMDREAFKAVMLIRLGTLQATVDRIVIMHQKILDRNAAKPGSAIQEVKRQRAYEQVNILKEEIQSELTAARDNIAAESTANGQKVDSYDQFIGLLDAPYAKASRYVGYLEELARDTW